MSYDQNNTVLGPSEAAGTPNATNAAASSIRAVTWPYSRYADLSNPRRIALRPPASPGPETDPLIAAINALQETMQQVQRSTRLIAAPWLIEPPDAESFHFAAGIVMPAQDGNFYQVATITCPSGRNGVLNQLANVIVGGGWSDFSGAAIWQLARNPPAPAGTSGGVPFYSATTAFAERNYQNILASLGLIASPSPISPIRLFENDIMSLIMKNVSLPVSGEEVGGLLGGYFYPRTWDDQFDARDGNLSW